MKQTVLARIRQVEKAVKPREKIYFGMGSLTQTENGYDLVINVSEKWFNKGITNVIEKHFDTVQSADSYLDELKKDGYINLICFRRKHE